MAVHFHQTSLFEEARTRIEQHLYDSVFEIEKSIDLALRSVDQFAEAIDRLFDTLEQMYQTPGPKDSQGEKSFPIREGRYRVGAQGAQNHVPSPQEPVGRGFKS